MDHVANSKPRQWKVKVDNMVNKNKPPEAKVDNMLKQKSPESKMERQSLQIVEQKNAGKQYEPKLTAFREKSWMPIWNANVDRLLKNAGGQYGTPMLTTC